MACTVGDIARLMEMWAPAALAEPGDNVGLLAGASSWAVQSVLISLDVTEDVIQYAASIGAGMVIAHHPFIYRPIPAVSDNTQAGRLAMLAIGHGIALFAAHTNLDRAVGGVNDALCDAIGLLDAVPANSDSIGRMAHTSPVGLDAFASQIRQALGASSVRVTGQWDRQVCSVYVISGAGRHDIAAAAESGADCMLTGEIGYHDGQDAEAAGLAVIEAGHYHTEKPVLNRIEKHLQSQFQRLQYTVRTTVYEQSTCPFRMIL